MFQQKSSNLPLQINMQQDFGMALPAFYLNREWVKPLPARTCNATLLAAAVQVTQPLTHTCAHMAAAAQPLRTPAHLRDVVDGNRNSQGTTRAHACQGSDESGNTLGYIVDTNGKSGEQACNGMCLLRAYSVIASIRAHAGCDYVSMCCEQSRSISALGSLCVLCAARACVAAGKHSPGYVPPLPDKQVKGSEEQEQDSSTCQKEKAGRSMHEELAGCKVQGSG